MGLREDLLARIAYWREWEGKATPGPWKWNSYSVLYAEVPPGSEWDALADEGPNINGKGLAELVRVFQRPDHEGRGDQLHSEQARANAKVLVAARNAWPKVLEMAEAEITKHRHIDPWRKHPEALYCEGCQRNVSDEPCPVLLRWSDVIPPIPKETA